MLNLRGEIPDVDGALVEAVLEHAINDDEAGEGSTLGDAGAAWRGRRWCSCAAGYQSGARPNPRWKPTIVVRLGSDAQPEVNGIPIAHSTVASLIADGAKVRAVHDDDPLANLTGDSIPAALARLPQRPRPRSSPSRL